jgi:hypothetical protein
MMCLLRKDYLNTHLMVLESLKKSAKSQENQLSSNKQGKKKGCRRLKSTTQAGEGKEELNDMCLM